MREIDHPRPAIDATASAGRRRGARWRPGRAWLLVLPGLFVLALLVGPIVVCALYSVNLATNLLGVPTHFSTANWHDFLTGAGNPFRHRFGYSIELTVFVSVLTTIAAYPVAYFLAFVARPRRYTLLLILLAPFFTSYLLRVIAWQVLLNHNGVINSLLWGLHLRHHGHAISWLIDSRFAVILVLFYSWVPFVALPIFVVLDNLDPRLLEASRDLYASKLTAFTRVTLPLSLPGVIAAFAFVLIPTTGEFIAPLLVGGANNFLFGNSIQSLFSDSPEWNYGAVLALFLVAVVAVLVGLSGRFLTTDLQRSGSER